MERTGLPPKEGKSGLASQKAFLKNGGEAPNGISVQSPNGGRGKHGLNIFLCKINEERGKTVGESPGGNDLVVYIKKKKTSGGDSKSAWTATAIKLEERGKVVKNREMIT